MEAPRTARLDRCPLCYSEQSSPLFRSPDRRYAVPGEYTYVQCLSCGSVFQDPQVIAEDIARCYPSEYQPHKPAPQQQSSGAERVRSALRSAVIQPSGADAGKLWGRVGRLLATVPYLEQRALGLVAELMDLPTGNRLALDVGCGSGALMSALAAKGWNVNGVERDPSAARTARALTGLPVHVGDFRTLDLPTGHFELVVLHHVFEHLLEPRGVLARIAALLAPGGKAVLIYPNPQAAGTRGFGDLWFGWDSPRHLSLPSPTGLREAAAPAGLRVVTLKTTARSAPAFFASSRALRQGKTGAAVDRARPKLRDHTWAAAESVAVAAGYAWGEELVAVLSAA